MVLNFEMFANSFNVGRGNLIMIEHVTWYRSIFWCINSFIVDWVYRSLFIYMRYWSTLKMLLLNHKLMYQYFNSSYFFFTCFFFYFILIYFFFNFFFDYFNAASKLLKCYCYFWLFIIIIIVCIFNLACVFLLQNLW